ncbi:MAG TPA: hypothetical protein DCY35_04645 [Prolixibacteraceae bacterium]|jgi:uncharacterized CHY-type Zn-finger protein|nr:hypothetical protein [Prolixibacteraceae bacterium]
MAMRLFCDQCGEEFKGHELENKTKVVGSVDKLYCGVCESKVLAFSEFKNTRKDELLGIVERIYQDECNEKHAMIFDGVRPHRKKDCPLCGSRISE